MNSLTYLSRQFDVLASAKTPPSTPTSERGSFDAQDRRRRSSTVSSNSRPVQLRTTPSKSFLLSQPKRSYSSPADIITLSRTSAAAVSLEPEHLPKSELKSFVRRILVVRVLALAWNALRSAWISLLEVTTLWTRDSATVQVLVSGSGAEAVSSTLLAPLQLPSFPDVVRSYTDTEVSQHESLPSNSLLQAAHNSSPPSTSVSRSSTPILPAKKTPFHLPKTLVLDLDETLIHSTSRPISSSYAGGSSFFGLGSITRRNKGAGHVVEVVLGGRSTIYHVYKRPFVDFFLRTVSSWYTLVIFTASMQEYADPVIDWLDAGRGILGNRLFRESCTQLPGGSYTKDLSLVQPDLSRVCLVDNSPVSYRVNEANGIPIEGWTSDPSDEALLDLLPILDSLRFTSDVRRILGLRTAGVFIS